MNDADNQFQEAKVPDTVPTETAMLAIALPLFLQQNQNLIQFLGRFLANDPSCLPSPNDLKQRLEPPLKQAAE